MMLKTLRSVRSKLESLLQMVEGPEGLHAQLRCTALEALRSQHRHKDPRSLIPFGYKVYSQTDEDGIISEIFNRIGTTNKAFIEFGIGDGLENNTLALLFQGWKGLWIEASDKSVANIRGSFGRTIASGSLKLIHSFVTRDNIDALISSGVDQPEIDLLSVDIDGNDFHVFDSVRCIAPRVVVIEYNAKFHPPISYCMEYDENHVWRGDDHFGASLKFLELGLGRRGYRLVGCNLTGSNAFFVREDLAGDKFLQPYTAENHYEPARYYLTSLPSGHRPSYKTLENAISANRWSAAPAEGG
jgi:hypothetical protein